MSFSYKFNILIVDDNPNFIDSLKTIIQFYFRDRVSSLYSAHNADECLTVLENRKIDIVFMDYDMPGMNGADLSKIISSEFRYTKIIAVTFHKESHIMNTMILNGARDYIVKEEINKESLERCLTSRLLI
jgi:DNA-binding NarL/FixJ family response regulator